MSVSQTDMTVDNPLDPLEKTEDARNHVGELSAGALSADDPGDDVGLRKGALDAISDVSAIVSASARHSEASAAAVLGTTWMTRGHPTTAWPPTVHHTTYAPAL